MLTRETQDTPLVTVIHFDHAEPQDTPSQAGEPQTPSRRAPINIEIDLEPGITIHTEPDLGMPFVVIESGRVHINLGINAGQASDLTNEHLALLDQLADAFQRLRDQIRTLAPASTASPDTATS